MSLIVGLSPSVRLGQAQELHHHRVAQRIDRLRYLLPAVGQCQQARLVAALGQPVEQQAGGLARQLAN
jgi:hypothetical protein